MIAGHTDARAIAYYISDTSTSKLFDTADYIEQNDAECKTFIGFSFPFTYDGRQT